MDKETFDRYLSEQWKWLNKEKKEYRDKKRRQTDRKYSLEKKTVNKIRKLAITTNLLRSKKAREASNFYKPDSDRTARLKLSGGRVLNLYQDKILNPKGLTYLERHAIVGANKFKARSALGAALLSTYGSLKKTDKGVRPRSDITWRQSVRDTRKRMEIIKRTLDHYGN